MSRLLLSVASVAVLFTAPLLCISSVQSAPKGSGPPPPGKIYYQYNGAVWQMNGDGSGKTQVNAPAGVPSQGTYGTDNHRWWLVASEGEIWATPNGVDYLQITDMSQRDNGDGTITVVRISHREPVWSNGGDSFISFAATHWVQSAALPVPPPGGEADVTDFYKAVYRLDISAAELEARYQLEMPGPAFDVTQAEPVVTVTSFFETNLEYHSWSPDGIALAYHHLDQHHDAGGNADLWVAYVGPEVALPVNGDTDALRIYEATEPFLNPVKWSPPGAPEERIAFRTGGARLMTIGPDGSGLTDLGAISPGTIAWSPDGNHIVFRQAIQRGFTWNYYIYRVPATGGSFVSLTGDLNRELNKGVLGWTP